MIRGINCVSKNFTVLVMNYVLSFKKLRLSLEVTKTSALHLLAVIDGLWTLYSIVLVQDSV